MWLKDVCDVCGHRSDTGQLERRLWAEAVEEVEAKPRARNSGFFMLQICVSIGLCVMSYACVSAVVSMPETLSVGFCTLLCVAVPLLVKTWEGSWQRLVNSCLSPILDHFCWHTQLGDSFGFFILSSQICGWTTQYTSIQILIYEFSSPSLLPATFSFIVTEDIQQNFRKGARYC